MKYRKLLSITLMSSMLVGLTIAQANEIVIGNEVVESPATAGGSVLISVTLTNSMGSGIKNVDLRLYSDATVVGNGVVQMGSIANEDTIIRLTDIVATTQDGNLPGSLSWQLDYDDVSGTHHQLQIGADLGMREEGQ